MYFSFMNLYLFIRFFCRGNIFGDNVTVFSFPCRIQGKAAELLPVWDHKHEVSKEGGGHWQKTIGSSLSMLTCAPHAQSVDGRSRTSPNGSARHPSQLVAGKTARPFPLPILASSSVRFLTKRRPSLAWYYQRRIPR